MPRPSATALVVLVAMVPAPTRAQQPDCAIACPGARVRVKVASSLRALTGDVIRNGPDSLVVKHEGDSRMFAIAYAQIISLDASRGSKAFVREGAKAGFLVGAGIGAIVGAASHRDPGCTKDSFVCVDLGPGFDAAVDGLIGGLAGALAGAAIGARAVESWTPVPLTGAAAHVGVAPRLHGGAAAGFSIAF